MKSVLGIYDASPQHWVGDGFPARSLFSYDQLGRELSPFLMLDYSGPAHFTPTEQRRGVGVHPHRGFETVSIVYQGELEHRDSTGAGGLIGPGDVQWMTAGAGILHEEFHSTAFARRGGTLEMMQLWVNLPARDKMAPPAYQTLLEAEIPEVTLPNGAGRVRVIAGQCGDVGGAARTFTEMDVWDLRLNAGKQACLPLPEGRVAAIVVLHGTAMVGKTLMARAGQWTLASAEGDDLMIEANTDSTVLVLSGEPLDEPIVGYGPFVMNTDAEIRQAIADVRGGRFGAIPASGA